MRPGPQMMQHFRNDDAGPSDLSARTSWVAARQRPDGLLEGATVDITPPKTTYNDPESNAIREDVKLEPGAQFSLFRAKHEPGQVTGLWSSKGSGAVAMTALGAAAADHHRRYGEFPHSTSSLSVHSRRIVQKAVDAGLIPNPSGEGSEVRQGNLVHHESDKSTDLALGSRLHGAQRAEGWQVQQGRHLIRSAFSNPKATTRPEFHQGRLF